MGLVTTADGDSVELVAAVPYGTQSFRVRSPLWRVRLQRPPSLPPRYGGAIPRQPTNADKLGNAHYFGMVSRGFAGPLQVSQMLDLRDT